MAMKPLLGRAIAHGCRITHGSAAQVKKPFSGIDLTMHNMAIRTDKSFNGQLGWMEFCPDMRLPRHVHMDLSKQALLDERILVLNGVGLLELAGEYYAVGSGSLVDIRGGVPHTWTACPAGVTLPDGTVSPGSFLMVYEYEDETAFFPTESKVPIDKVEDYQPFTGALEAIRFPEMSAKDVARTAKVVLNADEIALSSGL